MKLLITLLFLFSFKLFAMDYKIVTEHFPPYQMYKDGKLSGISVDIVNEIQRRAQVNYPIEVLRWDDAYAKALTRDNYIIFSIGRTLSRENNFQWVGPISNLKYVFFKNRSNKIDIKNLEDAKQVTGILVNKNDLSHQVLLRLDFRNLIVVENASSDANIRALAQTNKNVLWAADEKSGLYKIKLLGLQNKIKATMTNKPISASTLNIGFHKNADPSIVKRWQKILLDMQEDGTFRNIVEKYQ